MSSFCCAHRTHADSAVIFPLRKSMRDKTPTVRFSSRSKWSKAEVSEIGLLTGQMPWLELGSLRAAWCLWPCPRPIWHAPPVGGPARDGSKGLNQVDLFLIGKNMKKLTDCKHGLVRLLSPSKRI